MTKSFDAVDLPVNSVGSANYDSPWALEVQRQNNPNIKQEKAATDSPEAKTQSQGDKTATTDSAEAKTQSPANKAKKIEEDPQDAAYRTWYEGMVNGKLTFQKAYDLATAYCQEYGDCGKYHNEVQLKAISDWVRQQKERPCVEIDAHDWVSKHHTPTDEEIGVRIAQKLGFSESEMWLYATEHGCKSPGAAFYKAGTDHDGKDCLASAQHDPGQEGRVNIGEVKPGAIASLKKWLKEERESNLPPDPIKNYDYAKERTAFEAIFANTYNPVASAGDGLTNTLGDIVQGVGLPAHLMTDRTFMDHFADWLRKKGDSMPMYGLYTEAESNDAIVCIANIYGQAAGTAAPYLVAGELAGATSAAEGTEAALAASARSYVAAARIMGAAQMSGGVYNSALDFQAQQIALHEAGDRTLSPTELQQRVADIKEGKHIDAQKRDQIDRRALIAAVVSAPAGVIPGEYLEQLGALRSAGTPITKMPGELMQNLYNSALKGGLIGSGMVVTGEGAQVIAGVKGPQEAATAISENLPKVALGGAMIGVSGELVGLTKVSVKGDQAAEPIKPGLAGGPGQGAATQSQARVSARGGVQGRAIVPGESVIVGRAGAGEGQVLIDKNVVSAQHCRVRIDEHGNYYVTDLGSTNGTYINGQKLTPNHEVFVRPSDKVTLGKETPLQLAPLDAVVQFAGVQHRLKQGQEIPIGRNLQERADSSVSRNHLNLGLDENGVYITDVGSRNGTFLLRDGQQYKLQPGQKVYVSPTDQISLGAQVQKGGEPLSFSRLAQPEGSSLDARIASLPELESVRGQIPQGALQQSNIYATQHEISGRLEDGWHNAGAESVFDANGNNDAVSYRPAIVIDRQNDPVLREVLQEAKDRFGNLPPKERAVALTQFAKQLLTPDGWSGKQLDKWYDDFNDKHAGERILLGEMIREHKGVCSQQAILLKVMADQFPDMHAKLVRGNSFGTDGQSLNHAWTEFDFGDGKPLIFDPRQQVFGKDYKQYPHKAGRDINSNAYRAPGKAAAPVANPESGN